MSTSSLPLQILCIDDDPDFLAYLLSAAEPFNLRIHTCESIKAAHQMIASSVYDAYIVDLHFPDGSGFDLIQEIRKKNHKAPIVVISGVYCDEESYRLLKEKYAINYVLNKPIYSDQIEHLLSNLCLKPSQPIPISDNKLQDIKKKYDATIPDKIALLTKLVHHVQHHPDQASLIALKDAVHKIGGSAGSYGYSHVSLDCEELEYDIKRKLATNVPVEKEWLSHLNVFLNNIKYNYQVAFSPTQIDSSNYRFLGIRSSLFVVDSHVKFLELLEREKDQFSIDLLCEANPEKAIEHLKSPDFSPRAVIVDQDFPGSPLTGYDVINAAKEKPNALPTIFGILLSQSTIDMRMEAVNKGVKYIFHKPLSAHVLLQTMMNVLEIDSHHNFKVLVVDDDPDVCQFISASLTDIGIDVRILNDPTSLYSTIEEYMPQIVLLDILLPKYDGLSLLKTLRADLAYQNLIIIIITTQRDAAMEAKAYTEHVDDFFLKPLNKGMLQKRILNLLKRQALSGRLFLAKKLIGLGEYDQLLARLREDLLYPRQPSQYLALFEVDLFSNWVLQKGRADTQALLIFISNLLIEISDPTFSSFFYNSSKFALIFEGHDAHSIEEKMRDLLLKAKAESTFDISFSCGIVPISKQLGTPNEILHTAEQTLILARQQTPSTVKIAVYSSKNGKEAKKEIILIDSDQDLLDLLKMSFESHGIVVKTFRSGEEALQVLLSYNENQLPDLIISERKLPDMEGLEILKRLQVRFHSAIPFYILTVYSSDKDVSDGLHRGVSDYITKPFNLSILVQKAMRTLFKH